jgi:sugar O-acyltransferase (sialic acid O-acetyltransferase NeuD family)
MRKLVVLGAAGNSLEILDAVLDAYDSGDASRFTPVGFLDDNAETWGQEINGYPVLGALSLAGQFDPDTLFVNGIASTKTYKRKPEIIGSLGMPEDRFATIVHPSAVVSRFATVGAGSVILQNAVVGSGVRLGRHVHVLPLTVVSHDAQVDDFATIAGCVSVSGHVRLGRACYVGTAASIRGGVTVGEGAMVGMGAVVLNDVPVETVVAGVPAAELKHYHETTD